MRRTLTTLATTAAVLAPNMTASEAYASSPAHASQTAPAKRYRGSSVQTEEWGPVQVAATIQGGSRQEPMSVDPWRLAALSWREAQDRLSPFPETKELLRGDLSPRLLTTRQTSRHLPA